MSAPQQPSLSIPIAEDDFDALRAQLTAFRAATVALIEAHDGWEAIWMQNMKGYITDDEYAALQRLGALAGVPDTAHEDMAHEDMAALIEASRPPITPGE